MTAANEFTIGQHFGGLALSTASNTAVTATDAGVAWIVQAESAGSLSKFRFRYGARTGTPPTYVLTVESLDTSGNPNGTDLGGGSPTAVTFTPPADTSWDGTERELTLTNPVTVGAGDVLAVTIRYSSGTIGAGNSSSFTRFFNSQTAGAPSFPFVAALSGGVWTKAGANPSCAWLVGSSWRGMPASSAYSTNVSTAGHRSAMFITLPAGFGTTFGLAGVNFVGRFGAAAGSVTLGVWDSTNTLVGSKTFDADWTRVTSNTTHRMFFDSPLTLSYGQKYYIGVEVISGQSGVAGVQCNDANGVACYPNGTTIGLATYNGTTWTENTNIYPFMDLILSDITVPSGGGGGAIILGGLGKTGIGAF
jgi:hypothetical protein